MRGHVLSDFNSSTPQDHQRFRAFFVMRFIVNYKSVRSPSAATVSPMVLSKKQTADTIGSSIETLMRMVRSGKFPAPFYISARPKWPRAQVEAWLKDRIAKAPRRSTQEAA